MSRLGKIIGVAAIGASSVAPLSSARADLVLSQLVVELTPGEHARADVEAWNDGPDRIFVVVEPREILEAGTRTESSRSDPDPDKLGLLVSPGRMILEPGQRKLVRVASIASGDRERVFRVTVKPVVGQLSSEQSGLKVLIGYDMLVLVRPADLRPHVSSVRSANKLTLRNDGNVSVELVDGRECDASSTVWKALEGGRLYPGSQKTLELPQDESAEYKMRV